MRVCADRICAEIADGAQADWVAQFAIRVTGQTLRSLIQNWIATPLGLSADQFGTFLTPAMLANLVAIHTESPPGTFHATPIVMPQYAGVPPVGYQTLGSAPVYPTMPAFAKFLSTILATGPIFNLALSPFVQVAVDDIGSRSLSLPSKPVYISTNAFESNDLFQYESTRVRQTSRRVALTLVVWRAEPWLVPAPGGRGAPDQLDRPLAGHSVRPMARRPR